MRNNHLTQATDRNTIRSMQRGAVNVWIVVAVVAALRAVAGVLNPTGLGDALVTLAAGALALLAAVTVQDLNRGR